MNDFTVEDYKQPTSEHDEQVAYFNFISLFYNQHQELRWIYAIPNGGKRHVVVAKKLKAEGVKAGIPDIFVPVPMQPYHGLYIEMKVGKNKPTKYQNEFMTFAKSKGYKCVVCYSSDEAIQETLEYLKLDLL